MPLNFNQKVKFFHTSLLIIFCCLMFCSCHDKVPNSNFQLSLDEFKNSRSSAYAINSKVIRNLLDSIMRNDKDRHAADCIPVDITRIKVVCFGLHVMG